MNIAEIMAKMIAFSDENIHDIDHLIRVWAYAKTIGKLEQPDPDTQYILEADYIAHASENGYSKENVASLVAKIMRTDSGKSLTRSIFGI